MVDGSIGQAAAVSATSSPALTPVVVAVLARAEQLLGRSFSPIEWTGGDQGGGGFALSVAEAQSFAALAGEFGLCEDPNLGAASDLVHFRWC